MSFLHFCNLTSSCCVCVLEISDWYCDQINRHVWHNGTNGVSVDHIVEYSGQTDIHTQTGRQADSHRWQLSVNRTAISKTKWSCTPSSSGSPLGIYLCIPTINPSHPNTSFMATNRWNYAPIWMATVSIFRHARNSCFRFLGMRMLETKREYERVPSWCNWEMCTCAVCRYLQDSKEKRDLNE